MKVVVLVTIAFAAAFLAAILSLLMGWSVWLMALAVIAAANTAVILGVLWLYRDAVRADEKSALPEADVGSVPGLDAEATLSIGTPDEKVS
jgi:fatty acid desaturase